MFKLTSKLALSNIYKNRSLYFPFAYAVMLAISMLYIFLSLTFNPDLAQVYGGQTIQATLGFGVVIVQLFALIIILYANSFVMKYRVKELGLYGILGLERRHLHSMAFFELVIFASVSVSLGLLVGILLDGLMYAFLLKLIHYPVGLLFHVQWGVVASVLVSAFVIFTIVFVTNAWRVQRVKSLDLLGEKRRGEKKSRFMFIQTIAGLGLLGYGYYLAQSVKSPVEAIGMFFIAVLAVTVATYLLFQSGTIVFLQWLKKRKTYYYKPENFISVSNLIFRMKRNGVGLATICLLSSMALVALVAGVSLYAGANDFIDSMYPQQYIYTMKVPYVMADPLTFDEIGNRIEARFVQEQQLDVQQSVSYDYLQISVIKEGDQLTIPAVPVGQKDDSENKGTNLIPNTLITIVDVDLYRQITGESLELGNDEVAYFPAKETGETITIDEQLFKIKYRLATNFLAGHMQGQVNDSILSTYMMVVNDIHEFAQKIVVDSFYFNLFHYYGFNVPENFDQLSTLESLQESATAIAGEEHSEMLGLLSNRKDNETAYFAAIGSVFFIGVLLSILFASGLVLIIYYKQVAEGMEDRERFVILEKVGLSKQAANQTIRKQILTVFLLPIVTALIHCAVAFKMVQGILILLGIINQTLVMQVAIITGVVFLAFYLMVFFVTSRSYKKYIYLADGQ